MKHDILKTDIDENIMKRDILDISEEWKKAKPMKEGVVYLNHTHTIEFVVGRIVETDIEDDNLIATAEFLEGFNPKNYNVEIAFTLTPICSKCGGDFRECEHWFDEAHIIAKDIEVEEVYLVDKK